ncbi:hypothetical protein ANN_01494, partial [Periplaneta americana]
PVRQNCSTMASVSLIAVLILVIIFECTTAEEEEEPPVVKIEQGTLKGLNGFSIREKPFLAFLGIPYAKPPVGDLRFKDPQPPEPWEGIREAFEEGEICPQVGLLSGKTEGDEGCLFLNVFTNKLPASSNDLKPVMVWLHGGAFVTGSSTSIMFGPDHLLTEDVVLVTINYRLGILGFLALPDIGIHGNFGMKDQVMALRWVKKNIEAFGGDPNRVTLFGNCAGAASVQYHLLSPMSAGLFHRAISQSGSALDYWAYAEPDYLREAGFKVGAKIGCSASTSKELLECFDKKTGRDFVNIIGHEDDTGIAIGEFTPTREDGSGAETFLPDRPSKLIADKKFHAIPYMIGFNSREGLTFQQRELINTFRLFTLSVTEAESFWDKLDNNFDKSVARVAEKDVSKVKEASQNIKKVYFEDKKPSKETLDNFIEVSTQCLSDMAYFIGADRTVKMQAPYSTAPVYYYYFEFDGQLGLTKRALKLTKPGE